MNIDPIELIQEIERQFPKELTICTQADRLDEVSARLATLEGS